MRYILYARKSSEGDERQVQSIPDQHAVLMRLASAEGLTIVQTIDEAKSAKQPGTRPGFQTMLDALTAGEAEGILCWHLNRLSRNPVDSGTLSWLLQQGTIKTIRTAEREYRPEDNVVVMAVESAVSNQFIVDLRRNVLRGQQEKANRGWFPHKPPPGYRTDPESKEIVRDNDRFDLIRRAWELMLTGAYTVPEVQQRLDEWGYRHRRSGKIGNPINRSGLYALFDNSFYYGEFRFGNQTFQGKHEPMITKTEFDLVQRIIHKVPLNSSPRRHDFAFSGLMRCGHCGCMITAERKYKHYRLSNRTATYTYYHCTRSKGCREPSVTENDVEGTLLSALRELEPRAGLCRWLQARLEEQSESTAVDAVRQIEGLKREIGDMTKKRSRLLELRLADEIDSDEFSAMSDSLRDQINRATVQIERLEAWPREIRTTVSNLAAFTERASTVFSRGPIKSKREIAVNLIDEAVLSGGRLKLRLHPLLAHLATLEPPKGNSDMVQSWPIMPLSPVWQRWIDNIRTLVTDQKLSFPDLPCLRAEVDQAQLLLPPATEKTTFKE